jgi:hypothetical protein
MTERVPNFLSGEQPQLKAEDIKTLERVAGLLPDQQKAIDADNLIRANFSLTEADFRELYKQAALKRKRNEDALEHISKEQRNRNAQFFAAFFTPDKLAKQGKKFEEGIRTLLPKNLQADAIIRQLNDEEMLGFFHTLASQKRSQYAEPYSWKLLEALQEAALERCDSCFTTSQQGAATRTGKTGSDPKYDSIYYLYKFFNGTYMSQRFKRNLIEGQGIAGVIQPIAPLTLFVTKGDGLKLNAGEYPFSDISPRPNEGATLYEYFVKNFTTSLRKGETNISIPDVVEVRRNSLLVKQNVTIDSGPFVDIHEGTKVNKILKE